MAFSCLALCLAEDAVVGVTRTRGVTISDDPTRSIMIEFDDALGARSIVWVDPYTAQDPRQVVDGPFWH